jgi:dihydroflavonol-4-reductase
MRVLVTGAGGFLGGHVAARLLARGDRVTGLDLAFPEPPAGMQRVTGSILDPSALSRAAEGAEAVIHAAAITGLWARTPDDFERVNAGGTEAVLAAAARAGARRGVLVSSYTTLVSGRRGDPPRRVDETEELAPDALLGPYPRSKRRAELAAAAAPLPVAIVLPSAPVGPGDHAPTPPGRMLTDLANGRLPAMIDCGWNLVDVRDVAAGAIAALDRGQGGRRYLLAGEDMDTDALLSLVARVSGVPAPKARVPYPVALAAAAVSERVARLTGRPPAAPLTGVRLAGPRLVFDAARARTELGIAPGPVEGAIGDALAWFAARGRIARAVSR